MQFQLPQEHFGRLMRAIVEFDLIADGDRILIGLSGGKDSVYLTYALSIMQKRLKKKIELAAVTIDPKFDESFDLARLAAFCKELNLPFYSQEVDIANTIRAQNGKDPCYTCAFFRRGAINRLAKERGYNKIAYAHHHDDAVETFFMSLFYSGQLKTFLPKTYLDRSELTVIRPLVYFREQDIIGASELHGFRPVASPCPYNGKTKRQEAKELICSLAEKTPALYDHLAAAMRQSDRMELWPRDLNRKQLKSCYDAFMFDKKPPASL